MREHVPAAVRRWRHMRKTAIVLAVLATVPPAFAPSRNSEDLVPPGMIAPGCGSKVDELRGVCRGGDFRAA
jgi:hypothetical protein